MFYIGSLFLSILVSTTLLSCISMINQISKVRPEVINLNSNKPVFYPLSINTSKCSGSCNNIYDPYSKACVSDAVKNLNVKIFNLMSRTNETRHIKRHETCKCRCILDATVCNNWLIKMYAKKDMLGILVIRNLNATNHACWWVFRS